MYKSFFSVKFIPNVILFDAFVKGIVFLISSSDCSLLVYRRLTDFCPPATLLNPFISSDNFLLEFLGFFMYIVS